MAKILSHSPRNPSSLNSLAPFRPAAAARVNATRYINTAIPWSPPLPHPCSHTVFTLLRVHVRILPPCYTYTMYRVIPRKCSQSSFPLTPITMPFRFYSTKNLTSFRHSNGLFRIDKAYWIFLPIFFFFFTKLCVWYNNLTNGRCIRIATNLIEVRTEIPRCHSSIDISGILNPLFLSARIDDLFF